MQDQFSSVSTAQAQGVEARARFIWKVYAHVVGALLALLAIEVYLFSTGVAWNLAQAMMQYPMAVLLGFVAVSWGASLFAHKVESRPAQYGLFALYVFAWAVMFTPILAFALVKDPSGTMIQSAAAVTAMGCVGLIATAMITRKDFSFMRGLLVYGFFIVLTLIAASWLFGFQLGTWFSVGMIAYAGIAVLYNTSDIIHNYPEDKYVGAAIGLFGSIVMMLFYVLRLFSED